MVEATLYVGPATATLTASYLSDALGDLVRAVLGLVRGAAEATVVWMEEPGEFTWALTAHGRFVNVRIQWLADPRRRLTQRADEVLDATCRLDSLAAAVAQGGAQDLADRIGPEDYQRLWHAHDFPTEALRQLHELIGRPR